MRTLTAQVREDRTKSATRQVRKAGRIPAVVYGKKVGSIPVKVDEVEFLQLMRQEGLNAIFKLEVDQKQTTVMVGEVQSHPTKNNVVNHVDFFEVDMTEERIVEVPLEVIGESEGEKEGGILQRQYQNVEVRCLPTNIPDSLQVEVSSMAIGDSFTVADLKVEGDYEIVLEADTVLVSILPPAREEELETTADTEAAEPERVGGEEDQDQGESGAGDTE